MPLTKLNNSGKTSDVALNGVGYRLFNRKKQGQATFAPRSAQGQRDETQDLEYWWSERFDEFYGGIGQRNLGEKSRFWLGSNIELREDGSAVVSYEDTTVANEIASLLHVFNDSTTSYMYGISTTASSCAYTSNSSTFTDVLHNLASDPKDLESDGASVYATDGAEITKGTLGSATTFTNAWSAATVKKLLYQNKNLYGLSNDSKTFGSISTSTGTWTAIWSDTNLIDMAAEPGGGGVYILGKMGGRNIVWYYNGSVVSKVAELPTGFSATMLKIGWQVIFVGGTIEKEGASVWYSAINSSAEGVLFNLDANIYNIHSLAGSVKDMVCHKSRLYCALDNGTQSTAHSCFYYDMEHGGVWEVSHDTKPAQPNEFFGSIVYFQSQLWATDGVKLFKFFNQVSDSASVITSNTNLGTSVDKLLKKVTVTHGPLQTNDSLKVYINADDQNTGWTLLGTNSTAGATVTDVEVATTFFFNQAQVWIAYSNTGASGNRIVMYSISIFAVPLVDTQKRWELTIAAPDYPERPTGTQAVIKAASIFSNLWTAYDTKTIVSFQDVDYQTTKKVYGCVIEGMEETLPYTKGDQVQEGTCTLVLREVYNE